MASSVVFLLAGNNLIFDFYCQVMLFWFLIFSVHGQRTVPKTVKLFLQFHTLAFSTLKQGLNSEVLLISVQAGWILVVTSNDFKELIESYDRLKPCSFSFDGKGHLLSLHPQDNIEKVATHFQIEKGTVVF